MVLLWSAIFQKAEVKFFPHVYLFFPQTRFKPHSHLSPLPSIPRFLCTAKNCLFVIVASISCSFRANLRFEPSGLCCVWACLHPWVWMEPLQVLIQIQLQAERPLGAGTLETKQKVLASRAAECVRVCARERVCVRWHGESCRQVPSEWAACEEKCRQLPGKHLTGMFLL